MDIPFEERFDKQMMQRAAFLASAPSRQATILRWGLCLLIVAGTAYILYDAAARGTAMSPSWLARRFFVLAIGLYYLIAPYVRRWLLANEMWRKEQGSPRATGHVDNLGITYDSAAGEQITYPWADFVRLHEDAHLQLMVMTTARGIMVSLARPFFESEQDWTRAQQLVRLKVVQPS